MYYAVAHHGTAGHGQSYGYAELWEGEAPRSGSTTTVYGPYPTREQAEQMVNELNAEANTFRSAQP